MTCNLSYYGLFQRRIMRKMRLIDADKLKEYVNSISSGLLCEWDTLGVLSAIDKQQSIDAVPVVHAHPIFEHENNNARCSNCGRFTIEYDIDSWDNYCSFCGAKVDEFEE